MNLQNTVLGIILVFITAVGCASLEAQGTLAARVAAARDGVVRFRFAGKPGVCGDGAGTLGLRRNGGRALPPDDDDFTIFNSSNFNGSGRFSGRTHCTPGPVQVSLDVRAHQVEDIHTTAGPVRADVAPHLTGNGHVSAHPACRRHPGRAQSPWNVSALRRVRQTIIFPTVFHPHHRSRCSIRRLKTSW